MPTQEAAPAEKSITLYGEMEVTHIYRVEVTVTQSDLREALKDGADLNQILDEGFTMEDVEYPDSKPGWGEAWDFHVVRVKSE